MKNKFFVLILSVIVIGYASFLVFTAKAPATLNSPTISVPDGVLEVSVKDSGNKLLEGMHAKDVEDGDISSKIKIESMSPFDSNSCRVVTYIVFDKDDCFTRATRKIRYTDYEAPVFDIVKPMLYDAFYNHPNYEFLSAKSCIDGDLSYKIIMENEIEENKETYRVYSVTDSCGTKQRIKLKLTDVYYSPLMEITLSDYLIQVPKGTQIDPLSYVTNIRYMGIDNMEMLPLMDIQTDYNPNKEGTYEFILTLSINYEIGITKLTVIVE